MRLSAALVGMMLAGLMSAGSTAVASDQTRRAATDQQTVTTADIQRLQDTIFDVSGELARLRQQDPRAAEDMQGRLDDLRDETIYLKVKLRREGNVARTEYWDLRDRLDTLRSQVRSTLGPNASMNRTPDWTQAPPPAGRPGQPGGIAQDRQAQPPGSETGEYRQPRASNPNEVPAGTEIDVKLQTGLSSATARVEDRFEATTMVDLNNDSGRVLVPQGSIVRGVVTSVDKATRTDRKGSLTLSFDQVTIRGRSYPMHGTVVQALESEGVRGEAGKIGAGAGVGAIIGGILGGVKGALAGILIGGGGTVLATPGKDVELQPGTVLRVTFDSPLIVR